MGGIAIFNDITSVLKYGDITLVSEDKEPVILECKTSDNINKRVLRQRNRLDKLVNYLDNDKVNNLYGYGPDMVRVDSGIQEVEYSKYLPSLINLARKNGYSIKKLERGLYYIVIDGKQELDFMEKFFKSEKIKKPLVSFVRNFLFSQYAYIPIILNLQNPVSYWKMIEDQLNIIVLIDFSKLEFLLTKRGYKVSILDDENTIIEIQNKDNFTMKIGRHFFNRIFAEFVSLKWIIDTSILNAEKIYINKNGA